MARKTKEEAMKTRDLILETALEVFAEKGYARSTFENIAARIHLTKGAVYWHFKSKPDLLVALIRMAHERTCQMIGVLPDEPTWEELKHYFMARSRMLETDALAKKYFYVIGFQVEWSSELIQSLLKRIQAEAGDPFVQIRRCLLHFEHKGLLRSEASVTEVASMLISMWYGLARCQLINQLKMDLPAAVGKGFDAIAAAYLKGKKA